jgi:hypothetical protein
MQHGLAVLQPQDADVWNSNEAFEIQPLIERERRWPAAMLKEKWNITRGYKM